MFLMPGGRARPRNDRHVVRIKVQVFVTAGSATYTPSRGLIEAIAETLGAGAGGGGVQGSSVTSMGGGGGGSGSYSRKYLTAAQIGQSQPVTIGAGGVGGTSGLNNGSSGGDTSFGTLCIGKGAAGGVAGSAAQTPAGGAGGVAGTGDFTPVGNQGGFGFYNNTANNILFPGGGTGAPSVFGGGVVAANSVLVAANNYGAGGTGGYVHLTAANSSGATGSGGACIVTEFCAA